MKSKVFHDILRDKGAVKYSITKFLSLVFASVLVIYLLVYMFWLQKQVDHALTVELIGLIVTLVGLKNKWGMNSKGKTEIISTNTPIIDHPILESNVNDTKDDTEF